MKKIIIIIALIIFLGGGGFLGYQKIKSKQDVVQYETETAKISNIYQTVKETGKVESCEKVDLSFSESGKLEEKFVNVGDFVKKDDKIARLDDKSLILQKKEKNALLVASVVRLQKLKSGVSKTEIDVVKSQEQQALENYLSAQKSLEKTRETINNNIQQATDNLNDLQNNTDDDITSYEQAIITAEDTLENTKKTYRQIINEKEDSALVNTENSIAKINTAIDKVWDIIDDDDLDGLLSIKNMSYLNTTVSYYEQSLILLSDVNSLLAGDSDILNKVLDTLNLANKTASALSFCYKALEESITSANLTSNEIDAFKLNIDTQITTINSIITSLNSSKNLIETALISYDTNVSFSESSLETAEINLANAIKTAENNLLDVQINGEQSLTSAQNTVKTTEQAWKVAESQLLNISTGARSEDIRLAQLEIDGINASLDLINDRIKDSVITSPIQGKVIQFNYEIDEQIMAHSSVASVLNESLLKIEVYISEVDIAKISIGNIVDITLDAFGDEKVFKGSVKSIDPAETVLQDVVYYQVDIEFSDKNNLNIKSGMTANISINTGQKNDVLIIPNRAIINIQGKKIVRILKGEIMEEIEIQIGMSGDNGSVEVLKGLKAGDSVITYIK